jgi:DNA-binding SARP family transcriptional activator
LELVSIRLVTLGSLRCLSEGKEITSLASRRQNFAVLLFLALERDTTREVVMGVFWPEREPERARRALSQTLYELRRELGEGWLKSQGEHLIVAGSVEVDAELFTVSAQRGDLEQALSLYGGEFLAGEYLAETKPFEEWVDRNRARLARLHRTSRRDSVKGWNDKGDVARAILEARRWTELEPLEDEARMRLIELLAHGGHRADALREFELYERLLKAEDLRPLDDMLDLVRRLREGDIEFPQRPTEMVPVDRVHTNVVIPEPEKPERIEPDRLFAKNITWWRKPPVIGATIVAMVGIVLLLVYLDDVQPRLLPKGVQLDTFKYAILPFEREAGIATELKEDQLLVDAFMRWKGIELVDLFQISDAIARHGAPTSAGRVRTIGQDLGTGRLVRGRTSRLPDGLRIQATLYDANQRQRVIRTVTARLERVSEADSVFRMIADTLLLSGLGFGALDQSFAGTSMIPAQHAYRAGQEALKTWNLALADSMFQAALDLDPDYTRAYLWLAQVRGWAQDSPPDWRELAEQAARGRQRLSPREYQLASAVVHLSKGEFAAACSIYRSLTGSDPRDFAAWYGLGECHNRDDAVVRNVRGPPGWRFRSSYHQAVLAYQRAFTLIPSSLKAFRGSAYIRVRRRLVTTADYVRPGRALPPDTGLFYARASLDNDTLAFFPYPADELFAARLSTSPRSSINAIQRQQQIFHDIASTWVRFTPDNPDAVAMLAVALEVLGDPAALDTLRRARTLATEPGLRFRLAALDAMLRVKFNLPDGVEQLRAARDLADSLLTFSKPERPDENLLLASLAMLTGQAHRAASLARAGAGPVSRPMALPVQLNAPAQALLVYAVLGAPVDSMVALERWVGAAVRNHVSPDRQSLAYFTLLNRAAMIAFPVYQFPPTIWENTASANLLEAEAALIRGDTSTVNAILARLTEFRQNARPSDIMPDGFPEAWLLWSMGKRQSAAERLDQTLEGLPWFAPGVLEDFVYMGSVIRAAQMRAQFAHDLGDNGTARRWATAVITLWADAHSVLQPAVTRMRLLANPEGR